MTKDPIVEEVRAARQQHAARFDFDLKKIAEDIRQKRGQLKWPVAPNPSKPSKKLLPADKNNRD
ncbi:MAG TPA: hypothetical protein PLI09_11880 [Candidatus Hydrogenedentes bacterium]|nr:hypothetical protein [Candidatus Hydrogenedentota bacterium]